VSSTRLRSLIGLALASTVLLTGCNDVTAFNPGVAAQVGDQTIRMSKVDDVTTAYCAAAEKQLQEDQVLPQHYLRGQVAGSLALRAAADQFAAAQGVTADPSYAQAVKQAEQSLADLDPEQRQAIIDVQGAATYVSAVETSVGAALGGGGGAKAEAAAGQKAFQGWLADQDIRIDPRFGVSIADGTSARTDSSLSFATSDIATKADADQPDTDYAGGLPDSQRCG
jgi:peptidyl-prolyl cis-trans isomerase SurA